MNLKLHNTRCSPKSLVKESRQHANPVRPIKRSLVVHWISFRFSNILVVSLPLHEVVLSRNFNLVLCSLFIGQALAKKRQKANYEHYSCQLWNRHFEVIVQTANCLCAKTFLARFYNDRFLFFYSIIVVMVTTELNIYLRAYECLACVANISK